MTHRVTKAWLTRQLMIANNLHGTDFYLDYQQFYGYRLTDETGSRQLTYNMTNKEMEQFIDGMIFAHDIKRKV